MGKLNKIFVISLGCPKNLTDTEHVLACLKSSFNDLSFTNRPNDSDVILINTCAFIEDAVSESINSILELSHSRNKDQKVIVFGCLPLRYGSKLERLIPEVDKFIFHVEPNDVAKNILAFFGIKNQKRFPDYNRIFTGKPWQAYVKISDGCSNKCTYCLIPKIRGHLRCRKPEDIINEINIAVENGAVEIILVAQDLTSYQVEDIDLASLIEKILEKTSVPWLRLMYLYPNGITDRILDLISKESRICKYLDIPIQHASSRILKRMGRGYSAKELNNIIEKVRKFLPEASLRTTVIVGFPGEEERDFNILKTFIERWRFHHLGCFVYCDEEEAYSRLLDEKVDKKVANKRKDSILSLQREISLSINKDFIGKRLQVLVDGYCQESDLLLCSRTMFQAPDIDGVTYINKGISRPGALEEIRITKAFEYDLLGELIE